MFFKRFFLFHQLVALYHMCLFLLGLYVIPLVKTTNDVLTNKFDKIDL